MVVSVKNWSKTRVFTKYIKVFLDGIELPLCFLADDKRGIAVCYKTDESGRLILGFKEKSKRQFVQKEAKCGKVEFRFRDDTPDRVLSFWRVTTCR